jgi:glycosyltransferase involved in cell wall biosynthesis
MRWPPETFILRLIAGLIEREMDVTVACAQRPTSDWLIRPNFHWLPVPDTRRRIPSILLPMIRAQASAIASSPKKHWSDRRAFSFNLKNHFMWPTYAPFYGRTWDLIYFPWNSGAIMYEKLLDQGVPTIISCRGSQINIAPHNPERKQFTEGLSRTLSKATSVHCVSHDILGEVVRLGISPAKCEVIHPAVDPSFFTPPETRLMNNPLKVITTGSLIWTKGYEYALLTLQELTRNGIATQLEIIGDGPEKQRLLYTIDDLGLGDHVILLGKLPPDVVLKHLRQADIFVLSSLSEGISNAVLEAMSCQLPVVTTDCGGMREAVTDGVEGFVVPVRDPSAMAERLIQLYKNPLLRDQMGKAGRERVIKDFNLENQVDQFIEWFHVIKEYNKP